MFGIGFFELVLIAVAVLVVVGPAKLPDVMRQAGKLFVQLRRTANDVRGTFDTVIRDAEEELRREEQAALKELLAAKAAATAANTVTTTATQITDGKTTPHPDAPAGAVSMADPHATAPAALAPPAPHPAESGAVSPSQPATLPTPAPHPAGPDSIAGHSDPAAHKS